MRDFSGEVFTVFHCLLEDLEPLGESETVYYMDCPTCKKKTCEHGEDPVPIYLANMLLMTFDHKVQAKAIGNVVEDLLQIPARDCVPDGDGVQEKLENALANARSSPFNCKFIIGQYQQGGKNVLEVVHVKQTVQLHPTTPLTHFPSTTLKLVPNDLQGCPPCSMKDLTFANELNMLFDKPVNAIQLLVVICDSGEERGCMMRDGELVRVTRKALCALSGVNIALHRTGELANTTKYCKWNKGDVIYVVGRIKDFDAKENIWRIAMTAEKLFSKEVIGFANTYFLQYHKFVTDSIGQPKIPIEKNWTPKRRRSSISSESGSACTVTSQALVDTPLKYK